MTPAHTVRLGLKVWKTNVVAQKIDNSIFQIFEMAIANFWFDDKLGRSWFFQKTILMINNNMKMILGMFFLALSNADIQFVNQDFI